MMHQEIVDLPAEVDLEILNRPGSLVEYVGRGILQPSGRYHALAKIHHGSGTALARVELTLSFPSLARPGLSW